MSDYDLHTLPKKIGEAARENAVKQFARDFLEASC